MTQIEAVFGWSRWPFRIVADEEFAKVWADRSMLRDELERRLRRLRSISHSTIQLLWADFGAGKSHTLRYFQARCREEGRAAFIPCYTEVPVGTNGLLDIYRRFAAELPDEVISAASSVIQRGERGSPPSSGARDLRQALKMMGQPHGKSLALDWVRAPHGFPNLRDLKAFGISARIEDDIRVVEVMSELIDLISQTATGGGVVWLLDEFQRIADIPQRKRDSFAKSIVSLFNACPRGLHLVLSFSVAQQQTAMNLLPPDLKSRASTFPMLALPHLSVEEAVIFCQDLFASFRTIARPDPEYPFEPASLKKVVEMIFHDSSGMLTPRVLMEKVDSILFEAYDMAGDNLQLPITEADLKSLTSRAAQQPV